MKRARGPQRAFLLSATVSGGKKCAGHWLPTECGRGVHTPARQRRSRPGQRCVDVERPELSAPFRPCGNRIDLRIKQAPAKKDCAIAHGRSVVHLAIGLEAPQKLSAGSGVE